MSQSSNNDTFWVHHCEKRKDKVFVPIGAKCTWCGKKELECLTRRDESIDNIIGVIMQYQDYVDAKNEGSGKTKRGKSGGSDLDQLRAQAAAFAAARDRSKRVPCGDVIDALDHFFIHEWKWWF